MYGNIRDGGATARNSIVVDMQNREPPDHEPQEPEHHVPQPEHRPSSHAQWDENAGRWIEWDDATQQWVALDDDG